MGGPGGSGLSAGLMWSRVCGVYCSGEDAVKEEKRKSS